MKICDRTFNANHTIKHADHKVELGVEVFELCRAEFDRLRDFILNPNDWTHVSQIENAIAPEPVKRKRGRPSKADLERRQREAEKSHGLPSNPR